MGEGCVLGSACEYKHRLLPNGAQTSYCNYVGDSILADKAHLGAGAICSNLRLDQGEVIVHVPTGLRKFGAVGRDPLLAEVLEQDEEQVLARVAAGFRRGQWDDGSEGAGDREPGERTASERGALAKQGVGAGTGDEMLAVLTASQRARRGNSAAGARPRARVSGCPCLPRRLTRAGRA